MSSRKINAININKYKRKREFNIGIFIFAIVFIYLIVAIFMYATTKKISVYEVREGSILRDNSYTGLVIRKESVINAEKSGYINFFQNENTKVKADSNACVISSDKLSFPEDPGAENALSQEELNTLVIKTQNFNENFNPQKFSTVYSLRLDISNTLQTATNRTKNSQMDMVISEQGGAADVFKTPVDGILVLDIDGFEGLTADAIKKEDFDRSIYKKISLEDDMQVKAGEPAYKIVTSEDWSILIELDKNMAQELGDTTYIKARIDKDSETIWGNFSVIKKDSQFYGKLDFSNSMIRYSNDRFLNVELILEDKSGLKIPKSSVVEKDFYVIPKEYLTTGGNSSSQGVLVQNAGAAVFQPTTVYKDTKDGKAYLSTTALKVGDVLVKPDSSETFDLTEIQALQGVYHINRGYAVFKQVEILAKSDEYYIVQEGDSYGLYNYDHIVQDGESVEEGEVVF